jgi:predicted DNA-binding ribbon-helix-helix protein
VKKQPFDCAASRLRSGRTELKEEPPPFGTPTKRSVTIAGHETSIALEPMFWSALEDAAANARLPLNALIARIDAERLEQSPPPNLASAIRQWLFVRALSGH